MRYLPQAIVIVEDGGNKGLADTEPATLTKVPARNIVSANVVNAKKKRELLTRRMSKSAQ